MSNTQTYKKAIWLYVILLIFEGALRKWILPFLDTPLLLVREPIVLWLFWEGLKRGWLKNWLSISIMSISTLSFLLSLPALHQTIPTAMFGWRIYFVHIPFIFIAAKILQRDDVLKIGRFLLYLLIPMTLLMVLQFYSPQSAWVNRGVGNNIEGAGFDGLMGFFRPPGTFSFTSGLILYLQISGSFLFYFLINNKNLIKNLQIKPILLYTMLGCYAITIPTSISRTHLFQTLILILFLFIGVIFSQNKKIIKQFSAFLPISLILLIGLLVSGLANESIEVLTTRFENASDAEGGLKGTLGERYFGSFIRAFSDPDIPLFGNGLGLGTNIGAKLAGGTDGMFSFFNGEEEWVRITNESGIILGVFIILYRLLVAIKFSFAGFRKLIYQHDLLPWMLIPAFALNFINGSLGIPTNLGFIVLAAFLYLASLKK
ncbi:hypothetical protein [Cloacibacterium sp.]|uniref:hypothetical protein n=1 Tax=Cloacibacterium sp. TaxID=1913682 RepID=UPI0039E50938